MAVQTMTVQGDFWVQFELRNYPFDSQQLRIMLETPDAMQDTIQFMCLPSKLLETKDVDGRILSKIRDCEWEGIASRSNAMFCPNTRSITKGKYVLVAEAVGSRNYAVHMYRVLLVFGIFSLVRCSCFVWMENIVK
jgi:hypothetical protein